jgi:hypothetical protein
MNNTLELFNAYAASKRDAKRIVCAANIDADYERDKVDAANLAVSFLGICRCTNCKRLNAEGYVCIHCGEDACNDEDDEIYGFD